MKPSSSATEDRVRATLTALASDTIVEDRWAALAADLEAGRTDIVEDRSRRPLVIVALAAALVAALMIGGLTLSRSHRSSRPAVRPASSGHFTIVRPGVETRSVAEPPSSWPSGAGTFVSDDGSKVLNVSTQRSTMVDNPSNAEQRVDVDGVLVGLSNESNGTAFATWDDRGDVYGFAVVQPGSIDELTGIMPSLVHVKPDGPIASIPGFHGDPLMPGPGSTYVITSAAGLVMWSVPLGRSVASDLDHIVSVSQALDASGAKPDRVVGRVTVNGRPGVTMERADQNSVLFSPVDGWMVGVFPEVGPGDIAELTSLAGDVREVDDATWQHYVDESQVGDPPIVALTPTATGVTGGAAWTALVGNRGGRCVAIRAQGHSNAQCFALDPPAVHAVFLTPTVLAVLMPPGTEPVVELSDDNVVTTVPTAALGQAYEAVPNEGWRLHVFAVSPGTRHASAKAMAAGEVVSTSENVFAPSGP